MAETLEGWPLMQLAASFTGLAADDERDPARRFEAAMGVDLGGAWRPTELGEAIACSIINLIVRTAPPDLQLRAYAACEDDGTLDRIMADLRRSVLREVRKAGKAA